jgi:uncharacterized circularly permuted ATP-grasp superfamily protein
MIGGSVPNCIYTHVAGIDLVRDSATGQFVVLEDNVRTPSGVSYVLETGAAMARSRALFNCTMFSRSPRL